jgi:hypothetical protein
MTVARFIHERGADLSLVGGSMSSATVASYSLTVKATRALPDDADAFETASEALDRVLKLLDTESRAAETLEGHQRSCSGDLSVLDLGPENSTHSARAVWSRSDSSMPVTRSCDRPGPR